MIKPVCVVAQEANKNVAQIELKNIGDADITTFSHYEDTLHGISSS